MSSDNCSFVVYVDECGDEGFKFPETIGDKGSSLWLILSAAVFKCGNEIEETKCVDRARKELRRDPYRPLHFCDLRHEQKIVYAREVSKANFLATNIAVYKPNLTERATFSVKGMLYNFAGKLLFERVSWICSRRFADKSRRLSGNGTAKVIFSERRTFCPIKFAQYLRKLRDYPECGISLIRWDAIDINSISTMPHNALRGLQIADVLASSLGSALAPHPVSRLTEHRYARELVKRYYSDDGRILTYGIKTYPSTFTELGNAVPDDLRMLLGLQAAQ